MFKIHKTHCELRKKIIELCIQSHATLLLKENETVTYRCFHQLYENYIGTFGVQIWFDLLKVKLNNILSIYQTYLSPTLKLVLNVVKVDVIR